MSYALSLMASVEPFMHGTEKVTFLPSAEQCNRLLLLR